MSLRHFLNGRSCLVVCTIFASLVLGSVRLHAQTPPLNDMVPLEILETTTDDLIRLSTSYADAIRELKTAKLTLDTLQSLKPNAVLTGLEVRVAQVNVQTSESKVMVLRAIVEKQLVAAQERAEIMRRLEASAGNGNAAQTKPYLSQAQATIDILKMIIALK